MLRDHLKRTALGAVVTLIAAGIIAGCGGDDDSSSPTTPVQPAVQSQTQKKKGPTGPASAGDKRPAAPDDKISDRPGGPKDKRAKKKAKKRSGISGGISPAPASP